MIQIILTFNLIIKENVDMKRIIVLLVAFMIISLNMFGQNIFYATKKSYLCNEAFILRPDYNIGYLNDMRLLFAKDGDKVFLVVGTNLISTLRIDGKLIVYLDYAAVNYILPENKKILPV